jgi:tripartite-type tricarboxylate transporter receptor subunit TctC
LSASRGRQGHVAKIGTAVKREAQAGAIKALVVAQTERVGALKDVPTGSEAGLPAFDVTGWNAFFVPKGTPGAVRAECDPAHIIHSLLSVAFTR